MQTLEFMKQIEAQHTERLLWYSSPTHSFGATANHMVVKVPTDLGFGVELMFDLSGGDELIYISGAGDKDGLYFHPHEGSGVFSVEDLEVESLEVLLEECFDGGVDLDEFLEMSVVQRIELFEEQAEWEFHERTLQESLEDFASVT